MIYGYARVSTAAQCRDGNSLEDQVATLQNYGCYKIIEEAFSGKTMEEIEREFDGRGYGDFKLAVGEVCADALAPVQEKFKCYMADKAGLEAQMKKGAEEAAYVARRTLSKVQKKLGFVQVR